MKEKKKIMKYLILHVSGKQVLIKPSQWYDMDFIKKGNIGDHISLKRVLLYRQLSKLQVGKPFLTEGKLTSQIIQNFKGKKLIVLKTKPKKNYTRVKGHRQRYTRIQFSTF